MALIGVIELADSVRRPEPIGGGFLASQINCRRLGRFNHRRVAPAGQTVKNPDTTKERIHGLRPLGLSIVW